MEKPLPFLDADSRSRSSPISHLLRDAGFALAEFATPKKFLDTPRLRLTNDRK
jgi:hypothetical protein